VRWVDVDVVVMAVTDSPAARASPLRTHQEDDEDDGDDKGTMGVELVASYGIPIVEDDPHKTTHTHIHTHRRGEIHIGMSFTSTNRYRYPIR
jgi:hypothetical protein